MPETQTGTLTFSRQFFRMIVLAGCYAVAGKLALMLAIPPGYATAIFPPAGIAVIGLLLYGRKMALGVFLGSFILNSWVGWENSADFSSGLPVALSIAIGAALQAVLAALLIRRFVRMPSELTLDSDIIVFLLVAGPLACMLNASISISSLYFTHALDARDVLFSWFTWWVGDTLGVVVISPLILMWLSPNEAIWRKRRLAVGLPLLLMSAGLIWMFVKFSHWEVQQRQFKFNEDVKITQQIITSRFSRYHLVMGSLERFYSYSNHISVSEFKGFTAFLLKGHDDIKALSWNRYIKHEHRADFESALMLKDGSPFIFDLDAARQSVRAANAEDYAVVEYIEPIAENASVIGLNILSNSLRKDAVLIARDSGKVSVSAKVKLLQSNQDAFLMFYPVYHQAVSSVQARREQFAGLIVGVFALAPFIDSVLSDSGPYNLALRITDLTNDQALMYQSADFPINIAAAHTQSFVVPVGDRRWNIQYWQAAKSTSSDFLAFAVLSIGLLFTSILGAFLLVVTGRAHHIGQLVTQRSAELKGVLDNAIDAILTFDADGNIDSINPAGEHLLRYHGGSLLYKPVTLILPAILAKVAAANQQDSGQVYSERFDSEALRHDQSVLPVEVAISEMGIEQHRRYTIILHDLTERHRNEKLKDEIISTVSHELRTPLTSIMGSLSIVNSGVLGVLPDKAADMVNLALQNSQRLTRLINDILELNKHQAEDYQHSEQVLMLADFLDSAIKLNSGYASQYDVSVTLQAPSLAGVAIKGDELKLMQVMSNLLSNAIKYSPTQGEVKVRVILDSDYIDVAVEDCGPGIPDAFRASVFQRFSQADSTDTRRVGGTGLGLAIAKIIVEKHQGQLWFETVVGEGTQFYVRLPRYFA